MCLSDNGMGKHYLKIYAFNSFTTATQTFNYRLTFKGSQLDAFSPKAIVYCYLEFKLSYRVKELSETIVL